MSWGVRGWPVTGWLLGRLKIDGGTVNRSLPVLSLKQTWANVSQRFVFSSLNINRAATANSSATGSSDSCLEITLNGAPRFSLAAQNVFTSDHVSLQWGGASNSYIEALKFPGTNVLVFGASANEMTFNSAGSAELSVLINRGVMAKGQFECRSDARSNQGSRYWILTNSGSAGVLQQRDGSTGQRAQWFRTFTDQSNYERVELNLSDNTFILRPEAAGTGTLRPLYLCTATTTVANLAAAATVGAGTICHVTDATATTPRSIAAGGGANFVQVMSDGTNWLIVA